MSIIVQQGRPACGSRATRNSLKDCLGLSINVSKSLVMEHLQTHCIFSFQTNLLLFKKDIKYKTFCHFPRIKKVVPISTRKIQRIYKKARGNINGIAK